jgi:molybdopterin-biosynthesis enzyme MoeA-like protein
VLTLPACTCSLEVSGAGFSFAVTAPTPFTFNPLLTADLTDVLQQTMESISPSNLALLDVSETDLEFILKQILLAEKHTTLT